MFSQKLFFWCAIATVTTGAILWVHNDMPACTTDPIAGTAMVIESYVHGLSGKLFMLIMGVAAWVLACCRKWYASAAALILALATLILRNLTFVYICCF